MWTVRGVFDDRGEAERSLLALAEAGMPRECGHLEMDAAWWAELHRRARRSRSSGASLLERLRIELTTQVPGRDGTYADAKRRGAVCVVVHTGTSQDAALAGTTLGACGAFDVECHRLRWCRPAASGSKA